MHPILQEGMIRRGSARVVARFLLHVVQCVPLSAACLAIASPVCAEPFPFGHDEVTSHVTSLFTISKSENKNEVVYAIHLDAQCAPVGDAPIYAFWRMHEVGPNAVEKLLPREEPAYGIATQRVVARRGGGGRVELTLRALASRPIDVETSRRDGRCEAWSQLRIAGEQGYLYNVYVKIWLLGVEYLMLSGWATDRTHVLHEKIAG
jgi:hypothetical protein